MKRYEKYKAINLPWLSEIPIHWALNRNKVFLKESKDVVSESSKDYNLLSLTKSGIIPRDVASGKGKFPSDFSTYKIICPGDMVFCLFDIDETPRTVGLSSHHGMLTGAYDVFHVTAISSKYMLYYYLALDDVKAMRPLYKGLRKTINVDTFLGTKLPVPPRDEQDQIVRYLDWQVSKINRLIAAKRKQIQLLKERQKTCIAHIVQCGLDDNAVTRDSGIEYIGIVPSHWLVLQNRRLFHSMNRIFQGTPTVLSLSQKDGLIPYSEMSERSLHTSSYENWQLVHENDLVLNRFKAHLGVFFASKYEGIVTFHYGVYEPRKPLVAKYYEALYHTSSYCRVYAGQSRGMTVGLQNLSDTNFYSTYTVYPPYEEQVEIVSEISRIEKQHSQIIASIVSQIEMLQDLRTRLISDVVTGQIDVRGIEVPDYEHYDEAPENATEESSDSDYDTEE